MQLGRFRQQILIAMGLPACWTAKSPEATAPPPPDRQHTASDPAKVATSESAPLDVTWAPNPSAGQQGCIPETACGRSDTKHGPTGCGPHGDSLESFAGNYQKLSVTQMSWGANPGELRTFDLDPGETAAYRRTVTVGSGVDRYCCYSQCTPMRQADQLPIAPAGMQIVTNCTAAPLQVTHPHRNNRDCPATQGPNPYVMGTNAQCCYASLERIPAPQEERHYKGRAARIAGEAVVAPTRAGRTWTVDDVRPRIDGIEAATRAALRDQWRASAQMEHASVAAFSALSLRLIALGAPPDLIARAHEAALDEIRHAQLAFALASAYADGPIEPARFAAVAQLPTTSTLAELARETFLDGCIEETGAAVEAALAATTADDPVVADILRSIADDETRHAELAWAIVAWCVRTDPTILVDLRARLDEQRAATQDRAELLREIVAPCLAALA